MDGGFRVVGGPKGVGSGDQIKKIFQFFLDDLKHIPDLKCVLNCVLDNMNAFLILNVLFKTFRSYPFLYKSFQHF